MKIPLKALQFEPLRRPLPILTTFTGYSHCSTLQTLLRPIDSLASNDIWSDPGSDSGYAFDSGPGPCWRPSPFRLILFGRLCYGYGHSCGHGRGRGLWALLCVVHVHDHLIKAGAVASAAFEFLDLSHLRFMCAHNVVCEYISLWCLINLCLPQNERNLVGYWAQLGGWAAGGLATPFRLTSR